jgi:hemerythrin-like metal-binding protein
MALIMWSDDYSVGVDSLDTDHISLVGIINQIDEATRFMADKAAINGLLRALVDHTRSHFQREEALLKKSGYVNLEEHMALHQEMTEKLVALQQSYEQSSDPELGDDALEFLCTWFDEHVLEVDRRYKTSDICST